jgi:hypothetical protein
MRLRRSRRVRRLERLGATLARYLGRPGVGRSPSGEESAPVLMQRREPSPSSSSIPTAPSVPSPHEPGVHCLSDPRRICVGFRSDPSGRSPCEAETPPRQRRVRMATTAEGHFSSMDMRMRDGEATRTSHPARTSLPSTSSQLAYSSTSQPATKPARPTVGSCSFTTARRAD